MSELTLDDAIKHCLDIADGQDKCAEISVSEHAKERISQCAADHRQLAEWLTDYKELKNSIGAVKFSNMKEALELIREYKAENIAQKKLIAEYKRLLKAAVKDFAKLDRENAKNKNCMMPEMDCADCPLSWDSVDDRVEPCHSWRYANEALALIGQDGDTNG